ncbi:MAG TPA: LysR substrate-binding domain-containing protein [Candidatus Limnocylindria bacterium]|jgi:DNA-binding transcriptional LysR family regulator|nr:LysR substrate-binding domain-containing protein [Candidatus Limnocylindria bacterium]
MELYQLRYFVETARQRNFTRAAARLHLAQPALSEQIRKLEADLGTSLFHRGRRESTLTAAGQALFEHAEALLTQASVIRQKVHDVAAMRTGKLTIAAIPSVSAFLLPPAVARFRQSHPDVELRLMEGTSEAIAEDVESGRADLGFVQLPLRRTNLDQKVLFQEPYRLLCPRRSRLARHGPVRLAALAEEPFVLYQGHVRDAALAACRAVGFEPRIACETRELTTVHALVAAGLGVSLLPQLATSRGTSGCAVISIESPVLHREIALISRAKQSPSPAAEGFELLLGM